MAAIILLFATLFSFGSLQNLQPILYGPRVPKAPKCVVCTREAAFQANLDGQSIEVQCKNGWNSTAFCRNCCANFALSKALWGVNGPGFLDNDGRCICCIPC